MLRVLALLLLATGTSAALEECAPPEAIDAYEAGLRLVRSGDVTAAIEHLERAVSIYPDFYDAYKSLEWQYKKTGDFQKAIEAAEQQIRLLPGTAEQHVYAIQMYRRLLATPESAKEALARSALYQPGSDEAIAACREAIEIHPEFLEAHTDLVGHYMHADDEVAAKEQLLEVVALDARGAGSVLVEVMSKLKPDWLTEDFAEQLNAVFAAHLPEQEELSEKPTEYPGFSSEEVAAIVSTYDKQIAAISAIIDGSDDIATTETRYKESGELQEQLRSLTFISISGETGGPGSPPWHSYDFFDETRNFMEANRMHYHPYCWTGKTARDLDISGRRRADWRVGLCQIWIEKPYCRLRCIPALEFRVDTRIEDRSYRFKALLEDSAGIMRCVDQFGESPMLDW
jgi:Flp pilus assembly protein TadD